MKKILCFIIVLFCFSLWIGSVFGGMIIQKISSGGTACTTSNDSVLEESTTSGATTTIDGDTWVAQEFTNASDFDSTGVEVYIEYLSGTNSTTVEIYSDSGGEPGSLVSGATNTRTDISGTAGWHFFEFASPVSFSASTVYYVIVKSVGFLIASRSSTDVYGNGSLWHTTNAGTDWTEYASYDLMFRIYGCE